MQPLRLRGRKMMRTRHWRPESWLLDTQAGRTRVEIRGGIQGLVTRAAGRLADLLRWTSHFISAWLGLPYAKGAGAPPSENEVGPFRILYPRQASRGWLGAGGKRDRDAHSVNAEGVHAWRSCHASNRVQFFRPLRTRTHTRPMSIVQAEPMTFLRHSRKAANLRRRCIRAKGLL